MKKYLLITLLLLISFDLLNAQSIISGSVVDERGDALAYAGVVLYNSNDSSYVAGVASDENGLFSFAVQADAEYTLSISYVGYKTVTQGCKASDVLSIIMEEEEEILVAGSVISKRTEMDAKGYTVNMRSSDIVKGKQSSEVLAFLPGVTVQDGDFKINGLQVSEVYVDGVKLTTLDELNNLPADMIDKVRINYLAGSNQNASLAGGTINISLRKPPLGGYYGSVMAGTDANFSYGFSNENAGAVAYYRRKNLSVYDNFSLQFNQPEETADQSVANSLSGLNSTIKESTKYKGFNLTNRLSLNQQIDKKNSLGVSYYIAGNRHNTNSLTTDKALATEMNKRNTYLDQEATVKYSSILSDRGTTLDIVGDYYNRLAKEKSNYTYQYLSSTGSEDKSVLNMYKLSVDLTDPRSQKLIWQYGVSLRYINSDYTPVSYSSDGDNRFPMNMYPTRTGGLTPLIYATAMGQIWIMQYSVGLSGQLNRITYETKDDGAKSSDIQWGINPTVQLMIPMDKQGKHALMFNYKRTLDDIPYSAISSTIRWSDPYNYSTGNPDLKAPNSDMVLAAFSLFRNTLNLSLYYAHIKNNIYWETVQSNAANDVFYTMPVNLPSYNAGGVGLEVNWNPQKWWRMKISGQITINQENATVGGTRYEGTQFRQNYYIYNTFDFTQGWGGMLNIVYEPTFKDLDRTYFRVYNVSSQVYKMFCDDKLQILLRFNPFGNRRKLERRAGENVVTYKYTTPVQSIGLSLIWRFSGGKRVNVSAIEESTQSFNEIKDQR